MPDITPITGAQARASEVAVALDKVAIAVADAVAVVADLKVSLKAPVPMPNYVDVEPGLGFADWRCEVLSLLEPS